MTDICVRSSQAYFVPPETVETVATTETSSRGYLIHKLAKQAIWRPMYAIGHGPRFMQMYQTYLSKYEMNPADPIFGGSMTRFYRNDNPTGRFFRRNFVPQSLLGDDLTVTDANALRVSGASHIAAAARIFKSANYFRISGDLIGLADIAFGEGGTAQEAIVIGSDAAVCASFIGVQKFYQMGAGAIKASDQAQAYKYFKLGKMTSYSAFGLQTASAGIKLYNELERGDDASLSAVVDATADIGQGGAYTAYNYYLVSESQKVLNSGTVNATKEATDVLSVSARVIPNNLLHTMRGFGLVGTIMGGGQSVGSIYEGISGETRAVDANGNHYLLSGDQRFDKLLSGGMGFVSSLLFGVGNLLIAPEQLTYGVIATGGGLVINAVQTIYDEWGEIKKGAGEAWDWTAETAEDAWNWITS